MDYLEAKGLTNGYTSVIWNSPDEDLSFWYQNLKSSYDELKQVIPNVSSLEKSNMLLKLRETLLDQGEKKEVVTAPAGISLYPYNLTIFWITIIALVLVLLMARPAIPEIIDNWL